MNNPRRTPALAAALATLLTCPAVAGEKITRLAPPEHVIPNLTRMVVVELNGSLSDELAADVARHGRTRIDPATQDDGGLDGLRFLGVDSVAERSYQPLSLGESVALGARHGAQVVVLVEASYEEAPLERYTAEERYTETVNGQSVQRTATIPCARRSVDVSVRFSIVDVIEGSEVDEVTSGDAVADSDCQRRNESAISLKEPEQLAAPFIDRVAGAALSKFAPRLDRVDLQLMGEAATRPALPLARDRQWGPFMTASLRALEDDAYAAAPLYHVGLVLEVYGHVDEALALYRYAGRIRPNATEILDARMRADTRLGELRILDTAYRLRVAHAPPPQVTTLLATARKAVGVTERGSPATTRGRPNQRLMIMSEDGSDILATIPGGSSVRTIETRGALTLVQLPDGVEGWLSTDDVR